MDPQITKLYGLRLLVGEFMDELERDSEWGQGDQKLETMNISTEKDLVGLE